MRRNYYSAVRSILRSLYPWYPWSITLLWISLDWHGILAFLSPLGSYIVWTSVFSVIYISVLATYAPYLQHHTIICSTEVSSASLLSSARSVTTSTNIERHSHCPHRQGYQISIIIGYELERGKWILPVIAACCPRVLLCTHIYTLPRGAFC